jgi:quercetin dioxygenase-like cupin family protein
MNFYDRWIAAGEEIRAAHRSSPVIARDRDIAWVATRQDARAKLMVHRDLGFPTMGGAVVKAEIPSGWHTGRHAHGEESIHILAGAGFSIIDGRRYSWRAGSTIQIPFRAVHQHFNAGPEVVQYISASCFPLEEFVHLDTLQHLEDCGPNGTHPMDRGIIEDGQYAADGRRIVIHLEQAPVNDASGDPTGHLEANQNQHYKNTFLVQTGNGFISESVAVTHIFEEPPGYHGGRHAHLEAVLYVLEGRGVTEIEGVEEPWTAGDIMHVPPAMFEHEHFNETEETYKLLRIQFGIRFWFTDIWPEGYTSRRVYDEFGRPMIAGRIERQRER